MFFASDFGDKSRPQSLKGEHTVNPEIFTALNKLMKECG
jgi:hypothetical protein